MLAISAARRSIAITNPYFLPDEGLLNAMVTARRRGVRVRVLLPGAIDHAIVKKVSRAGFEPLFAAGVEIYEYQAALLHAKTMVIDGLWSTIGTTNFDNRSFALHEELNLVVYAGRSASAWSGSSRTTSRAPVPSPCGSGSGGRSGTGSSRC